MIINHGESYRQVSLDQVGQREIFIVLSEGIVESLGNFEPTKEKEKLEGHEDRIVEVQLVSLVLHLVADIISSARAPFNFSVRTTMMARTTTLLLHLPPEQPLFPYESDSEVEVDSDGDDLSVDEGDRDVAVVLHLTQ